MHVEVQSLDIVFFSYPIQGFKELAMHCRGSDNLRLDCITIYFWCPQWTNVPKYFVCVFLAPCRYYSVMFKVYCTDDGPTRPKQ